MRRNDVASTSFRRRVPIRFLINQCQIITFLILKCDIIENSRIELRGIVLPVQMGGLFGGAKGYVGPPPKLLGGPGTPPPPPPPPLAPHLPTPMNSPELAQDELLGYCDVCRPSYVWTSEMSVLRHTLEGTVLIGST